MELRPAWSSAVTGVLKFFNSSGDIVWKKFYFTVVGLSADGSSSTWVEVRVRVAPISMRCGLLLPSKLDAVPLRKQFSPVMENMEELTYCCCRVSL